MVGGLIGTFGDIGVDGAFVQEASDSVGLGESRWSRASTSGPRTGPRGAAGRRSRRTPCEPSLTDADKDEGEDKDGDNYRAAFAVE